MFLSLEISKNIFKNKLPLYSSFVWLFNPIEQDYYAVHNDKRLQTSLEKESIDGIDFKHDTFHPLPCWDLAFDILLSKYYDYIFQDKLDEIKLFELYRKDMDAAENYLYAKWRDKTKFKVKWKNK